MVMLINDESKVELFRAIASVVLKMYDSCLITNYSGASHNDCIVER